MSLESCLTKGAGPGSQAAKGPTGLDLAGLRSCPYFSVLFTSAGHRSFWSVVQQTPLQGIKGSSLLLATMDTGLEAAQGSWAG